MDRLLEAIRSRLLLKIIIPVAGILFAGIFFWSLYHIEYQQKAARASLITGADRVANAVKLGLHYAMMLNARNEIQATVDIYGRLEEIRGIRIINKAGAVMFASNPGDIGRTIPRESSLCQVCHVQPQAEIGASPGQRVYSDTRERGEHLLRLASPILNEPSCSSASACHFHRADEQVLGIMDLSLSLSDSESFIQENRRHTVFLAIFLFGFIFLALFVLVVVLIKRPINRIIADASVLSQGKFPARMGLAQGDEIGQLAQAIFRMGSDLITKNEQLKLQKNQYQDLFEGVPCLVTVQDRDFRLISFNRTFGEHFSAKVGDYCYKAYKNLDARCPACPVEKTFKTGQSQTTEESGCYRDGSKAHWIVNTSPIYDADGNIVAAMEMNLDITERKELERELKNSEKKYCDIFNNIPSSVFVLDQTDFSILDCNRSATLQYGYSKEELTGMLFLDLFADPQNGGFAAALAGAEVIDQTKHLAKGGREFFVSINSSPSEFASRKVYLVTTSDITKRLEAEQQLIQASKMATLGEMATGVAHEINQPLAVIQTSIDLVQRQLGRGEMPERERLSRVAELVGEQVDRATRIISHMREFGRKSEIAREEVDLNQVLCRVFEFFSQQLSLRSIEIDWELDDRLPLVRCEPNRMEQVFINFLINARDAIEERAARSDEPMQRRIGIKTMHNRSQVTIRISDTGVGVPEALAQKIFEPFFTTKQVGKGTGLGLSISYGIVKDYGGSIHVTGNESGGASFYIRLPVARQV